MPKGSTKPVQSYLHQLRLVRCFSIVIASKKKVTILVQYVSIGSRFHVVISALGNVQQRCAAFRRTFGWQSEHTVSQRIRQHVQSLRHVYDSRVCRQSILVEPGLFQPGLVLSGSRQGQCHTRIAQLVFYWRKWDAFTYCSCERTSCRRCWRVFRYRKWRSRIRDGFIVS